MLHFWRNLKVSLSTLPVRNGALGDFWIPVHLFVDQPKPTPLMLGMDCLKEQRSEMDALGKDLIGFPVQSDCSWTQPMARTPLPLLRSALGAFLKRTMRKLLPQSSIVCRFLKATCIQFQTMST